jgi:ElaB/YqjD/DUF883 family membrane-anchored ribosome-binding protein
LFEGKEASSSISSATTTFGFSAGNRREHDLAEFALTNSGTRAMVISMADRFADEAGDLAERSLRYTREQFDEVVHQTEDYVRANPARSMFYAFIVGFILNRLPIGGLLRGAVRLLLFAVKPAILIYGATKLYQAFDEEE